MAKAASDPSELHLEEIIHEDKFNALLEKHAQGFFRLCNFLANSDFKGWNKKHYFQCITESNEIETFLDDYGARYNKAYSYITELAASLRGFGHAAHSLKHIENRYEKYSIEGEAEDHQNFQKDLADALIFTNSAIASLAREILAEAGRRSVSVPADKLSDGKFTEGHAKKHLPRNVDEEELLNEEQKIAEISSKYLRAVEMFEALKVRRIPDPDRRRAFIVRHCSEDRARVYEATIHNLQSKYDTYIKNTTLERKDKRLHSIRGHISVALHLLEAVTHLVHFYERHENDIRSEKTKSQIAELIDKKIVLDKILNFSLFHADRILKRGKVVAEALLPHYTNVQSAEVVIPEGRFLHARPASLIVAIVNHYSTPVEMQIEDKKCNAASIMQVMILAGSFPNARKLLFHGDEHPLEDIRLLFEHGLGEKGLDDLPEKLSYLKS